jgi:hypothetical protein
MTHNIYILFYVLLIFDYYANIQDIKYIFYLFKFYFSSTYPLFIFYLRGVFQVDAKWSRGCVEVV